MPRSLGFVFFFTIVLLLVGSVHYWIWARLVRDLALPPGWQRALGALVVLLGLSVPLTFYLSRALDPGSARPLLLVLFAWLGIMFWLVVLLGGAELIRVAAWIWERTRGQVEPAFAAERRTLLARALGGAVVLVAGGFTAFGARSALGRVQVKRVEIPLKRLPRALDGFSIVQLSDVHVGPTIGRDFIEEIVATCNALEADVVAITGDLVDGPVSKLSDAVAPLAELRSRQGAFFVTGNHEYYSGAEAWCRHLSELGLRVLRNEHVTL
ncbi:MAG: metallophosphoesterase, partial [Myxococcales bacterium]|nr:metallophosphoesterase [Myxococcales bacterium]